MEPVSLVENRPCTRPTSVVFEILGQQGLSGGQGHSHADRLDGAEDDQEDHAVDERIGGAEGIDEVMETTTSQRRSK